MMTMIFFVLQFVESRLILVSQFNIGEVKYTGEMCYVNTNIIMTGFTPKTIRVYQEGTGNVLNEWNTCHLFPRLMVLDADEEEHLLESCIYCRVIRGYPSPQTSSAYTILYEDITSYVMCKGPTGSILSFEKQKSIKQFSYSKGRFHLTNVFPFELQSIKQMSYYENDDILVVLDEDWKTVTGVKLARGQVVWKKTEIQYGSPGEILELFQDLLPIPDGKKCIFNLWKPLIFDPKDGAIKHQLHNFVGSGWIGKIATRNNGNQQIFAILNSGLEQIEIYVYYLSP